MASFNILELSLILSQHSDYLASAVSQDLLTQFIDVASIIKPFLEFQTDFSAHDLEPLEYLPDNVLEFLQKALQIEPDISSALWSIFRFEIWKIAYDESLTQRLGERYVPLFLEHGPSCGLVFYTFCPPTRTCLDPQCTQVLERGTVRPRLLTEPSIVSVTVFTHSYGALPGQSVCLYCRKCNANYYNNYYVHSGASLRTYYQTKPAFIHSAKYLFMDTRTCEVFTSMMVNAWTSARNCARIYNDTFSPAKLKELRPLHHATSLDLDEGKVWNALFLYWLIMDALDVDGSPPLVLQHKAPNQAARLQPALDARNRRIAGTGQEQWNHACDLCYHVNEKDDGTTTFLRSVVVDGITIGRPCCSSHDCKRPLVSVKDRFCADHYDLNKQCCAVGCKADTEPGFRTCEEPDHRALETWLREENKAAFQLKRRLQRHGASGEDGDSDEELDNDVDGKDVICEGKPPQGNRAKGRFSRCRTHNEETCVACCGVMLARATFFGSEAPNGVREFLKAIFPTQESLPRVIWHDNNCKILAMLESEGEEADKEYFSKCAMPVDIFHFKAKHKADDVFCNTECNALIWKKELQTSDGKWQFNSSAAEQSNAWMGRFLPIVREMEAVRYGFFLDEMIMRRNRIMLRELERKGASPYQIPRHVLLG